MGYVIDLPFTILKQIELFSVYLSNTKLVNIESNQFAVNQTILTLLSFLCEQKLTKRLRIGRSATNNV